MRTLAALVVVLALPATARAELHEAWHFQTGGPVHGAAAVAGGTAYVPSEDGHVYAVDLRTGRQRWALATGSSVWATPAVTRGMVYVGSGDDRMYAVRARDGRRRWTFRAGGDITGGAALARGLLVFGSSDHHVYALSRSTGRVRWRFRTGDRVASTPVVSGGTVYVGGNDATLYALDLATGRERWSAKTDGWIWGRVAVDDARVYVVSNHTGAGHLYAFDRATGRLVWSSSEVLGGVGGPLLAGDAVIAPGIDSLNAYDRPSGALRWSHPSGGDSFVAPGATFVTPALSGDTVLTAESQALGDSALVGLDPQTGAERWRYRGATLGAVFGSPVLSGDHVLFGADDGALHGLTTAGPWQPSVARAPDVPAPRLPYRHRDVLGDMLDPDSMTELRASGDGVATVQSTLDVRGRNNDYNHFHGVIDGRPRKVVAMDVHGAGVVTNLFMGGIGIGATSVLAPSIPPPNDPAYVSSSRLTIYVDDDPKPIVDTSVGQFYSGGAGFPFVGPLVAENSAGQAAHVPIPYRRHFKVVLTQAIGDFLFWFDGFYTRFPDARSVPGYDPVRDRARYAQLIDRWKAAGRNPRPARTGDVTRRGKVTIAPGQRAVLLDAHDAGEITELRLNRFAAQRPAVTHPDGRDDRSRDAEPLKRTFVQARWDDGRDLAVDAPVDAFFGTGFGQAHDYDSLIFGMHGVASSPLPPSHEHPSEPEEVLTPLGASTYTYFPMPFARHAEVALVNRLPAGGTPVDVEYTITYRPQPIRRTRGALYRGATPIGYFNAREFHNEKLAQDAPYPDRDANDQLADLRGPGTFVGMVLNGTTHNFGSGNVEPIWQEGDCMFWIDDDADFVPSLTSTGHEECFDGGFYYENVQNTPTSGVTKRDLSGNVVLGPGNYSDEISTFHLFTGDAIGFQKRLQATIEHGANDDYAGADESGVWFAYLSP